MITLALDTSTTEGSVAVYAYGEMAFFRRFQADRTHSSDLFLALEKARGYAGRFDRVAVGLGPGSYAGVRVGIAAALGINHILGAELVGMPSVAALETEEEDYFAIGDARRGSFYLTWIHGHACQDGPRLASERDVREEMGARALPVFATSPVPAFPSVQIVYPSAKILAEMSVANIGIVQRDDLEPLYLRDPHITQPKAR